MVLAYPYPYLFITVFTVSTLRLFVIQGNPRFVSPVRGDMRRSLVEKGQKYA